jgi:putative nucleotidyltransferase with HDIG domain
VRPIPLLRRTLRALAPGVARPDDRWARSHLTPVEYDAYRRMDPRDRDHACRVARRLLQVHPDADALLLRAALLHDVGKAQRRYRLLERIAVHALPTPPAAFGGLRSIWLAHRDHPRLGAAALRSLGVDPRVVELVERHHQHPAPNAALAALAAADESA